MVLISSVKIQEPLSGFWLGLLLNASIIQLLLFHIDLRSKVEKKKKKSKEGKKTDLEESWVSSS